MAAKTAPKATTKVVKKTSQAKKKLETANDGLRKTGVDRSLVARAVDALLKHHHRTSEDKTSLLGNDSPVQVQFALLRAPEKASPKPIRILVPHPLFKLADKDDDSNDATEDPEICLIVKEESKPWCQEMIDRFPDHMGCIKKVLGLQSLRKKHAQYAQRRELLDKYNMFMADDRILPMLTKALGKDFFKAKKQPIPINLSRKEALPFAIQKALSATYMTLSQGTCVMVKAGHTAMDPEKLVENIVEIAKNAVPKFPRKWANVQVISVKVPESVALPVYNKTPQVLSDLAKLSGTKVVAESKDDEKAGENKGSKKKKVKSPLLQALKKVEDEGKKKVKKDSGEKKEAKTTTEQRGKRRSSDADEGKKSTSSESMSEILDSKKKKKRRSSSEGDEPKQGPQESRNFVASKKFNGSKKGYVFRAGVEGVGYYIDLKPVVDRAAMEAIKRMTKGAKGANKGRRGRRSY